MHNHVASDMDNTSIKRRCNLIADYLLLTRIAIHFFHVDT